MCVLRDALRMAKGLPVGASALWPMPDGLRTADEVRFMTCRRCGGRLVRGSCLSCGWEPVTVTAEPIVAQEAHKRWPDNQEAFMRANMHRLTGRELAEQVSLIGPRRTWKAVKHWFARQGLSKPAVRRKRPKVQRVVLGGAPYKHWSEAESEALECNEVKILSHRSPMALAVRASRMGVPLRSGDGFLSATQVAVMHRIHPQQVTRLIQRKRLAAHRSGDLWRIDPEEAEKVPGLLREAKTARRK